MLNLCTTGCFPAISELMLKQVQSPLLLASSYYTSLPTQAISDTLVELAPMYSDVVLSGVLTMLDSCGSASIAPPALVAVRRIV